MTTSHDIDDSAELDTSDDEPEPRRFKPMTIAIIVASVAFTAAVIITGTRFIAGVDDLEDTPAQSVDGFLTALFIDGDSESIDGWLCAEKRDRDVDPLLQSLSQQLNDTEDNISFSEPHEESRDVGTAVVTTELVADGDAATWTFTLVAEDSSPQWVVCNVDAE